MNYIIQYNIKLVTRTDITRKRSSINSTFCTTTLYCAYRWWLNFTQKVKNNTVRNIN